MRPCLIAVACLLTFAGHAPDSNSANGRLAPRGE